MIKKQKLFIILTMIVILSSLLLTAANPWKARLKIINQTKEDIYIILRTEDKLSYPQLLARGGLEDVKDNEEGETTEDRDENLRDITTVFTIVKDVYEAEVLACGMRALGRMDLRHNLKLNFTPCDEMEMTSQRRYLGEPTMEKPNWFKAPGMADWRFVYEVPVEPAFYETPGRGEQE